MGGESVPSLQERLSQEGILTVPHCPLARHSTLRIGGTAALGVFPKTGEQLITALSLAAESGEPYAVVGKGSNLLFADGFCQGTVIFTVGWVELTVEGERIYASAGTPLTAVSIRAREQSLTGAEFAAGIPGTVGGAVLMNAGAFGGCMANIVQKTTYWDAEARATGSFEGEEHAFGERTSRYATDPRYTILSAEMAFKSGDKKEIDRAMEEYRVYRKKTQPLTYPNAGSIFKRPRDHYAGRLIQDCGLKGVRVGGAEVSLLHAGFIINRGNATAQDVITLIRLIRARVLEETGVCLECELRILGEDLSPLDP